MKIRIPDHSILLNTQDAVQAICQFMLDELKFNHFDYGYYYDSGKNFTLTNDTGNGCGKTWLQRYYEEGVYITIDELEQLRQKYNNPRQLIGFLTPEIAVTDELPNKSKHRT